MKKMATMTSPLISVFEWSVKAIVGFFSARKKSSADVGDEKAQSLVELKAAAALARASRLISAREEKIVTSAAMMTTRAVREIILPASEIATIKRESTIMDAFVKAHLDMHTRFPVCATEGDPQSIIGYVNFKDILVAMKMSPHDTGIKGIVRPIKIIDGAKQISVVLEQLIQEKAHITLVADKEGKILGMVTLEDILEELVGEIEDEFDRLPTYVHSYGSSWLMGGGVSMTTVASTLGVTFMPDHPHKVPTLSEWCIAKSGGSLVGGDVMEKDGILVVFRKLRRKRLVEAVVSLPKKRG
jgi:putative hemolysin